MIHHRQPVLVVSSDPDCLTCLQGHFGHSGFRTLLARDGEEALDLARQERPAIVITDLDLPRKDGFALTLELWGDPAFAELPIVWMVGPSDDTALDVRLHGFRSRSVAGRTPVILPKPFRCGELVRIAQGLAAAPPAILVIEDDPACQEIIAARLEAGGFGCVPASTGQAGLGLARDHAVAAILLDLRLPDQDGLELLGTLRRQLPELPIIVMTAHGSEAIAVKALTSGASDYLIKPIQRGQPLAALRKVLATVPPASRMLPQEAVHAVEPEAEITPELPLSARELEVMAMVAHGLDTRSIADQLVLSERTVANHLSRVYQKLKVTNRTQALLICLQNGWVNTD
ncbi:MAG TPA: response regulator [Stenomitos sp.]